jgi:hypothetical protein
MLKYLFVVEYKDGSVYEQTPEDISKKTPEKSAFSDVTVENVAKFYLVNEIDIFCVDLNTGLFAINGIEFGLFDEEVPITSRKLIYFRRNWQHLVTGPDSLGPVSGRTTFHIGWEGFSPESKFIRRVIWVE